MKKQSVPQEAKHFKFKFTPLMIILACGVIVLCSLGIALSLWRIARDGVQGFNDALKSPFLIAVCLFGIAVVVGVLVKSRYIVTKEYFITQFGFIKSKFPVKDFTSLILNTDEKKLTIYMGEAYLVTSIDPEWNNDLVQAIREVKPDIDFSFTLTDKETK